MRHFDDPRKDDSFDAELELESESEETSVDAPAPGRRPRTLSLAEMISTATGYGFARQARAAGSAPPVIPQQHAPASAAGLLGALYRKSSGSEVDEDAADQVVDAQRSSGEALPAKLRQRLERALGVELSAVRVHTGARSDKAARSVGALAYTTGQSIHFAAGQYDPGSQRGLKLIAHEVAHTVQQRGLSSLSFASSLTVSEPGDSVEREADSFADSFATGALAPGLAPVSKGVVSRAVIHRKTNFVDTLSKELTTPDKAKDALRKSSGDGRSQVIQAIKRNFDEDEAKEIIDSVKGGGAPPPKVDAKDVKADKKSGKPDAKGGEGGKKGGDQLPKGGGAKKGGGAPKDAGPAAGPDQAPAPMSSGEMQLVYQELVEHQAWAAAGQRVGAARSVDRGAFIAEMAGKGMMSGAASGFVMGAATAFVGQLASRFVPIPGVGAILAGGFAAYGLLTRDWGATADTLSKFGEGSSDYEVLANSIAAVSEIIDIAVNVMNVIAGILGIISAVMWIISIITVGAASPLAATLSSIALGITAVTGVLDLINNLVLQPCVLLFRALHTFTSEADPREIESQGDGIADAANKVGNALGGMAGEKAGGALGAKTVKGIDARAKAKSGDTPDTPVTKPADVDAPTAKTDADVDAPTGKTDAPDADAAPAKTDADADAAPSKTDEPDVDAAPSKTDEPDVDAAPSKTDEPDVDAAPPKTDADADAGTAKTDVDADPHAAQAKADADAKAKKAEADTKAAEEGIQKAEKGAQEKIRDAAEAHKNKVDEVNQRRDAEVKQAGEQAAGAKQAEIDAELKSKMDGIDQKLESDLAAAKGEGTKVESSMKDAAQSRRQAADVAAKDTFDAELTASNRQHQADLDASKAKFDAATQQHADAQAAARTAKAEARAEAMKIEDPALRDQRLREIESNYNQRSAEASADYNRAKQTADAETAKAGTDAQQRVEEANNRRREAIEKNSQDYQKDLKSAEAEGQKAEANARDQARGDARDAKQSANEHAQGRKGEVDAAKSDAEASKHGELDAEVKGTKDALSDARRKNWREALKEGVAESKAAHDKSAADSKAEADAKKQADQDFEDSLEGKSFLDKVKARRARKREAAQQAREQRRQERREAWDKLTDRDSWRAKGDPSNPMPQDGSQWKTDQAKLGGAVTNKLLKKPVEDFFKSAVGQERKSEKQKEEEKKNKKKKKDEPFFHKAVSQPGKYWFGGGWKEAQKKKDDAHQQRFAPGSKQKQRPKDAKTFQVVNTERVNVQYPPPPPGITPAGLEHIREFIEKSYETKAKAEAAERDAKLKKAEADGNAPEIKKLKAEAVKAEGVNKAHKSSVDQKKQANDDQQKRQGQAESTVGNYASRAAGIATLTVPLGAFAKFTYIGSKLGIDAFDRMNKDATDLLKTFAKMDLVMKQQKEAQPAKKAHEKAIGDKTSKVGAKNQETAGKMAKNKADTDSLDAKNQAKIQEGSAAIAQAGAQKQKHDSDAKKGEAAYKQHRGELVSWAQQHKAAREAAEAKQFGKDAKKTGGTETIPGKKADAGGDAAGGGGGGGGGAGGGGKDADAKGDKGGDAKDKKGGDAKDKKGDDAKGGAKGGGDDAKGGGGGGAAKDGDAKAPAPQPAPAPQVPAPPAPFAPAGADSKPDATSKPDQ